MSGTVPNPTPIRRLIYLPNLAVYLRRGWLDAPNAFPVHSGWIPSHNVQLQSSRGNIAIRRGPGGTLHDYVPFYFGTHTPMMLQLHTGQVTGYTHDQQELIYLVSTAQAVQQAELGFVFSDGHGYAAYSNWFDDLSQLNEVDWTAVASRYWGSQNDPSGELQRKKQAEFLVYRFMDWSLVQEIVVYDAAHKEQVQAILRSHSSMYQRPIDVRRDWYF